MASQRTLTTLVSNSCVDSSYPLQLTRILYRNLLRTLQPFLQDPKQSSPGGKLLCSLLHRSNISFEEEYDENRRESENLRSQDQHRRNQNSSVVLYKRLLGELFGQKEMIFPCQVSETNFSVRLKEIIQREFRSCSRMTGLSTTTKATTTTQGTTTKDYSRSFSDQVRRETAFLALRQLNQKLQYAENLGFFFYDHASVSSSPTLSPHENRRIFSHEPRKVDIEPFKMKSYPIVKLSTVVPSTYLQPGTFLIAHPFVSGYFAKSVIVILSHSYPTEQIEEEHEIESRTHSENVKDKANSLMGGTYGLVLNRPAMIVSEETAVKNQLTLLRILKHQSNKVHRNRTLRDTFREESLPANIMVAFGNSPIREGGPVNLSVQMLRRQDDWMDEKEEAVENGNEKTLREQNPSTRLQKNQEKQIYHHDIGGTILPMNQEYSNHINFYQQHTMNRQRIYFGGDIMKAAQSVIDEVLSPDDFSFIVGASCWETGQLEKEIEMGYWLPCAAPPHITFHEECEDLWLSMMCSVGDDEGLLAYYLLSNDKSTDDNGDACDANL